jgi:hypothetical protein
MLHATGKLLLKDNGKAGTGTVVDGPGNSENAPGRL